MSSKKRTNDGNAKVTPYHENKKASLVYYVDRPVGEYNETHPIDHALKDAARDLGDESDWSIQCNRVMDCGPDYSHTLGRYALRRESHTFVLRVDTGRGPPIQCLQVRYFQTSSEDMNHSRESQCVSIGAKDRNHLEEFLRSLPMELIRRFVSLELTHLGDNASSSTRLFEACVHVSETVIVLLPNLQSIHFHASVYNLMKWTHMVEFQTKFHKVHLNLEMPRAFCQSPLHPLEIVHHKATFLVKSVNKYILCTHVAAQAVTTRFVKANLSHTFRDSIVTIVRECIMPMLGDVRSIPIPVSATKHGIWYPENSVTNEIGMRDPGVVSTSFLDCVIKSTEKETAPSSSSR